LAYAGGAVFGTTTWPLFIAAAVSGMAGWLAPSRRWQRVAVGVLAVVGTVMLVVSIEGGNPWQGTIDSFRRGPGQLLSTEWPSPRRPGLVGTVAAALAVVTGLAAELARHARWRVLPALPLLVGVTALIAAAAPAGPQLVAVVALVLATVGLLLGSQRAGQGSTTGWLAVRSSPIRAAPFAALLVVGGLVLAATAWGTRSNPRSPEEQQVAIRLTDQLAAVAGQRSLEPAETIATIESVGGQQDGGRGVYFRTGVLTEYDGVTWTNRSPLRPIGGRLGSDADADASVYLMVVGDRSMAALPTPGVATAVDRSVLTDGERTSLFLDEPLRPGTTVEMSALPFESFDADQRPATRPVDDLAAEFSVAATRLAGEGSLGEQLLTLQRVLVEDFSREPLGQRGGGQQLPLIDRFVNTSQRGTAEQFVSSYVLMARSLGVDARIAYGYIVPLDEETTAGDVAILTTKNARSWVEIRSVDGRWLTVDPVPAEPSTEPERPDEQPPAQSPSAAPSPAPPAPDLEDRPAIPIDETDDEQDRQASIGWGRRVALGTALAAATVVSAIGGLLFAKLWRRRRRLSGDQRTVVRGAWAAATDALVDRGVELAPSTTNGQIVAAGSSVVGGAGLQLRQLATLDDRARYAATTGTQDPHQALLALRSIERGIAGSMSRFERIRWRLSTRSLQRKWRSPVRN
jgi:hypothetical protein